MQIVQRKQSTVHTLSIARYSTFVQTTLSCRLNNPLKLKERKKDRFVIDCVFVILILILYKFEPVPPVQLHHLLIRSYFVRNFYFYQLVQLESILRNYLTLNSECHFDWAMAINHPPPVHFHHLHRNS